MSSLKQVDWHAWVAQAPPLDFVETVSRAVQRLPPGEGAMRTRQARRHVSRRAVALSSAAGVAALALVVLARVGPKHPTSAPVLAQSSIDVGRRAPARTRAGATSTSDAQRSAAANRAPHARGTVIDSQLRERLRAQIVPSAETSDVEIEPHTGLTIPSPASGPSHNLTREYIRARVQEDFLPLARSCYESALSRQPALRGQLVVDFMIVGDAAVGGIVDQAKANELSTIHDPEMVTCVVQSMLSMVFEPPANNGWVSVTYPFAFWPDGDAGVTPDK